MEKKTTTEKKKYIPNPKKFGVCYMGHGKPFILSAETSQANLKKLFEALGEKVVKYG